MSESRQTDGIDYRAYLTPMATAVGAPLVLDEPDAYAWDDSCDLLIIGGGLAGATAALRGAELGLDIVLADRFGGGGTSELSGGVIYAGGGTRVQRECGVEDSPAAMADYLQKEVGDLLSRETVRRYAERSADMLDWLERYGVHFAGPLAKKKASYPPPGDFLYYSGNETVPVFAGSQPPAPRGHRVRSEDPRDHKHFSGAILMSRLFAAIAAKPAIRFRKQSAARRLIVDATGWVIGVEVWQIPQGSKASHRHAKLYDFGKQVMATLAGLTNPALRWLTRIERKHAQPLRIRARRGVLLACGGYVNNRSLVKRTAPVYAKATLGVGPGEDGSALRLTQGLNPLVRQTHLLSAWRFINPPYSWMKGIVVDAKGQRLTNEEQYGARLGDAICQTSDGKAWLIIDSAVKAAATRDLIDDPLWLFQRAPGRVAMWLAKSAPTIATLEAKLEMPTGSLSAAVDTYNRAATSEGVSDPLGKAPANRQALTTGPFYAMNISSDNPLNPIGAITLGGLDVDESSGMVRAMGGGVIQGLYAAGRAAVGICSANYISGLSLGDCVFSGLRAAESIAAIKPAPATAAVLETNS